MVYGIGARPALVHSRRFERRNAFDLTLLDEVRLDFRNVRQDRHQELTNSGGRIHPRSYSAKRVTLLGRSGSPWY